MTTDNAPAKESTRRRMTLNLSAGEYEDLAKLAKIEHADIHETIRRAFYSRLRIHRALNPQDHYSKLPSDKIPEPERLAFIGAVTGNVRYIELFT